eukprot:TRINITY_DN66083_c9_g3_i1.p1 TRINITY_DN66083_c9_g3~~TRINITY_DN66083_c9_g3_i1.p1  ORF type:complete len:441 (-),score=173.56 TRINITY_DN66083_c9_g3_i1:111-1433(-)
MNLWFTFFFAGPAVVLWAAFLLRFHAGLKHVELTGFHALFVLYLTVVTCTLFVVDYDQRLIGTRHDAEAGLVVGILYHVIMSVYIVLSDHMGLSKRTDIVLTGALIVINTRLIVRYYSSTATISWLFFTTSVGTVQASSLLTYNILLVRVLVYRMRFPRLLAFKSVFKPAAVAADTGKGGMWMLAFGSVIAVFNLVGQALESRTLELWTVGGVCWLSFSVLTYVDRRRAQWWQAARTFNFAFTTFVLIKLFILNAIIFQLTTERAASNSVGCDIKSGAGFVVATAYWSMVYAIIVSVDYFDVDRRVVKVGLIVFFLNNAFTFVIAFQHRLSVFVGSLDMWALFMSAQFEFTVLLVRLYRCKVLRGQDFYRMHNFVRPTVIMDHFGEYRSDASMSINQANSSCLTPQSFARVADNEPMLNREYDSGDTDHNWKLEDNSVSP